MNIHERHTIRTQCGSVCYVLLDRVDSERKGLCCMNMVYVLLDRVDSERKGLCCMNMVEP